MVKKKKDKGSRGIESAEAALADKKSAGEDQDIACLERAAVPPVTACRLARGRHEMVAATTASDPSNDQRGFLGLPAVVQVPVMSHVACRVLRVTLYAMPQIMRIFSHLNCWHQSALSQTCTRLRYIIGQARADGRLPPAVLAVVRSHTIRLHQRPIPTLRADSLPHTLLAVLRDLVDMAANVRMHTYV